MKRRFKETATILIFLFPTVRHAELSSIGFSSLNILNRIVTNALKNNAPLSPRCLNSYLHLIPILWMHEFLSTGNSSTYRDCISCNKRTAHTCIKCYYCYSCHANIERLENVQTRTKTLRQRINKVQEIDRKHYKPLFITYSMK